MQIQEYIKAAQASGQTTTEITLNLTRAGWPADKIASALTHQPAKKEVVNLKVSSKQSKLLFFFWLLLIVILLIPFIKLIDDHNSLTDRLHGFKLSHIYGWKLIKPEADYIYSMETRPDFQYPFPIANMDIKATPNNSLLGTTEKELGSIYLRQCKHHAAKIDFQYISFETISIPFSNAFRCTMQEKKKNKYGKTTVRVNTYVINQKYNVIFFGTFPKEFPDGLGRINGLIGNLHILE